MIISVSVAGLGIMRRAAQAMMVGQRGSSRVAEKG